MMSRVCSALMLAVWVFPAVSIADEPSNREEHRQVLVDRCPHMMSRVAGSGEDLHPGWARLDPAQLLATLPVSVEGFEVAEEVIHQEGERGRANGEGRREFQSTSHRVAFRVVDEVRSCTLAPGSAARSYTSMLALSPEQDAQLVTVDGDLPGLLRRNQTQQSLNFTVADRCAVGIDLTGSGLDILELASRIDLQMLRILCSNRGGAPP